MKKQFLRLLCALCMAAVCTVSALAAPRMLIPGGNTVGIKLNTRGLVVTDFEEGSSAREAGMKKGDVITKVDGKAVHTVEVLKESIEDDDVILTVLRNGRQAEFCVTPKERQIGAYVRNSIAGIGTVTYYDPICGTFGALGHGVNDANSTCPVPVEDGAADAMEKTVNEAMNSETKETEVKKGKSK